MLATLALKPRGDVTIGPKKEISAADKKDMSSKFFLKKLSSYFLLCTFKSLTFHEKSIKLNLIKILKTYYIPFFVHYEKTFLSLSCE